jgi:hypothetical protein
MAFQILSGVRLNNGPWGQAFGGGIYAANCEIGFSRGPTKITLNIVSESGFYYGVTPNVYNAPYNINFNGHIFSGMYLYSYEKQKSAEQSIMTADFIDSSLILDKIYIGLLNRQGRQYVDIHMLTGFFTVRCPQESQGYSTGISGIAYRAVDYITVNEGCYFKKGEDGGGYIILGSEYFPANQCDVPRVDYNFSELCSAMSYFGINHQLDEFDLNPLYRQEYVGTLREVLNNWGADFAFEFFVESGVLKGIDLQTPINVNDIQTFAETNEYVNSVSCGESLENSSSKTLIARYLKAHELVTFNNTYNYKVPAYPITIGDILQGGACVGRTAGCLLNSIALARLDPSLREAYLANYAIENNRRDILQAIGLVVKPECFSSSEAYPVPVTDQMGRVAIIKQLETWRTNLEKKTTADFNSIQTATNTILLEPNNYEIFIGIYSADLASRIEQWDREAASFLGKYYYYNARMPNDLTYCPAILGIPGKNISGAPTTVNPINGTLTFPPINLSGVVSLPWTFPTGYPYSNGMIVYDYNMWSYKWSSNPTSQTYGGDAVPFASLLRDPVSNTNLAALTYNNICSVNDNSWGIEEADYLAQKGTADYTNLKPQIILWKDFPVAQGLALETSSINGMKQTDYLSIKAELYTKTATQLGGEVAIFIIPKLRNMSSVTGIAPSISNVYNGALNRYVYNRALSQPSQSVGCKTYCEYSSIESEICNLVNKSLPFTPYFANLFAPYSMVYHPNGNISKIVFPCNSTFYGNWTLNLEQKTTAPPQKLIYGEPPSTPNNTMSTQIIDYDMTSDMTAIRDNNDAINSYVYSTTNQRIMTTQDYYNSLASLNNIIIPPQKTIKMTIANVNFSSLGLSLSPADGLTSINLTMNDGGIQASLEYSSRPKTVPKAEAIFPKVKFRILGTPNSRGP